MTNTQTFSMESINKEKVRDLIITELNAKINYFKLERLSNQVRYGEDRELLTSQIDQLQLEKESWLQWLESAAIESNFTIKMNITITKI
jgi:hypothetical protein